MVLTPWIGTATLPHRCCSSWDPNGLQDPVLWEGGKGRYGDEGKTRWGVARGGGMWLTFCGHLLSMEVCSYS